LTGTYKDYVGLGTLSLVAILTVLIAPILQLVALLAQWFMSLNRHQRKELSLSIEIIQAWQYVEVYLIAIVVGSWQLGPISGRCFLKSMMEQVKHFQKRDTYTFMFPACAPRIHDQSIL
jgi:hypothetical protein